LNKVRLQRAELLLKQGRFAEAKEDFLKLVRRLFKQTKKPTNPPSTI
jgi:hypothetical protein